MPYPSLLWKRPLGNREEADERKIPENVMRDLYLNEELRPRTLEILGYPCSREEIPMRQNVFAYLLGSEERIGEFCILREKLEEFGRLAGRLERAESEYEKVLLFLTVMKHYFECAAMWSDYAALDNRIGEAARHFKSQLEEEKIGEARRKCEEILSRRPTDMSLTVRGGQSYATENRKLKRTAIEEIFMRMGLDEAVPPEKHPAFAIPEITRAFCEVYPGYYESVKGYYNRYAQDFLGSELDVRVCEEYTEEISFYADTVQYFEKLKEAGCPLCYPTLSDERMVELDMAGDPSLLRRGLTWDKIVANDVRMYAEKGEERLNFFILSGANGGGKTTYLRSCGIAVLFFITGCPVAAKSGRMYPFDSLYTHFPADESFDTGGRFVNEAERADEILSKATADSFVLFNETYSGTDEKKSEDYASRLAETLYSRGVFGIFVTHIHALTGGKIPTLAPVIDESDENRRTYRIRRVGGTDSSFAADILAKYGLDKASLKHRLAAFGKEEQHD